MLTKPNLSSITLYSSPQEIESHVIRFIMAEKNIEHEVINLKIEEMPEDILDLNPCRLLPVLYDRNVILYDLSVIMEYLDERYPFPPLLPIDLIEKAKKKLFIFRLIRAKSCCYELVNTIEYSSKKNADKARKILLNNLIDLIPFFDDTPYFKSETMTIIDACMAPILWRLKKLNINFNNNVNNPIIKYADRLFDRKSFKKSLTDFEKEYM